MQRSIILGIEDIETQRCGLNFAIVPPSAADNLWIILDPEAVDELVRDIAFWKQHPYKEGENDVNSV